MWELPQNPRFSQEKFYKYFIFKCFVKILPAIRRIGTQIA